jgi:hypothetical protein
VDAGRRNDAPVVPHQQAGIGVYERGDSGLLSAARIYDDVDVDLGLLPSMSHPNAELLPAPLLAPY